jgi:hypothetical protein
MATTSGTINTVTKTVSDMITDALQDLRVLLDGATPTAGDLSKGLTKLNFMVKKYAVIGALLWVRDTIQIPLITNIYIYTIGPGGDVDTYRPLRAFDTSFFRVTCGVQSPNDIIATLLSRKEYFQMSYKGSVATPTSFYYDPQMAPSPFAAYDPASAKGVLYVWQAPPDMTRTLFLDVQRPIQDLVTASQTFDIPLEWYDTISKVLAAMMADAYEIPEQRIIRIKREAKESLDELGDWGATEQAPIEFQPDWRMGQMRNRY